MKTPGILVSGLGVEIPDRMPAEEAVRLGLYSAEDHEFYGWTGAAVAGDTPAPDLAIRAARQAVARTGAPAAELDVHFHAAGYEQGPEGWSAQHYVLRHVTDRDIPSYRISQSCAGLVGTIELAACYLLAAPTRAAALLTGSDNVGIPNFNRWDFGLQNGVIGDAGSALVLSRRSGFGSLLSINSASTADVEERYRGDEPIFPPSAATGRKVDFRERLAAGGEDLVETLAEVVTRQGELRTEVTLRTFAEAGITPADITRVAHVFTPQESYLKVLLDPIGLRPEQGLREFGAGLGHLTVNDQVVGLEHLVRTRQVGPGDHVLLLAHGGGVSITSAVVRIDHTPDWVER